VEPERLLPMSRRRSRLRAKCCPAGELARATFAEIFGQFTEGFDTVDLKDAKALLDDLEH